MSSPVFPVTIALLAEDGQLVKLEEELTQAPSMACSLVQEQGTYVLVQVISTWGPKLMCCTRREGQQATDQLRSCLASTLAGSCP